MSFNNRLILTHRCNAKCPHCFNVEERTLLSEDMDMNYDKLAKYLEYNKIYLKNSEAKIMGGEPTIHNRFVDIIKLCLDYYDSVRVFTNGMAKPQEVLLSDQFIIDYIILNRIKITFNSLTFADQRWLKNIKLGEKFFHWRTPIDIHFVVNERNSKFLLNKMRRIVSTFPTQYFDIVISSDVSVNIFNKEEREVYKQVWKTFLKEARQIVGIYRIFYWDHSLPPCFYDDELLEFMYGINHNNIIDQNCYCTSGCNGLIDPDFSIWFCNQFRHKVGNVYENGDIPLSYDEIDYKLKEARIVKNNTVKEYSSDCLNCQALNYCKGGCFCNKLLK